ncbi:MAG TPA: winged helix-turn-helix domain-containing protein, partial [Candidatus Acidoferrales bacterium]|nr:winged helix-turn-helix domain-containing protein [Candidatus Acidoferrales bacterium]
MADRNEEEIYSIMFKSLKHPVRRQILRMLNDKPMPFMEMVALLGVSSSHLTYHLESLGELITKTDDGQYRLSSFGTATVSAMKGVEEAPELSIRRPKKLARKWKATFAALMVVVLLLSSFGVYQYITITQLAADQSKLEAENQQLLSWGIGAGTVADMLRDVVQLDTNHYKITLQSNTLEYRDDFDVAEEVLRYSFTSAEGSFNVNLRFRENHLSRYQLTDTTDTPQLIENQSSSSLDAAKAALDRYSTYSKGAYLTEMSSLLEQVNATSTATITSGNLKLQISNFGSSTEYLWFYTQNGIDFSAKSLRMTFNSGILTALTDGYFLFTIDNTDLNVNSAQAEAIAKAHVEEMTWALNGTETSGFKLQNTVSVEMLPHPRGNSVALVPYWYVVLELDQTYTGGFNRATVGVWGDTGEVA